MNYVLFDTYRRNYLLPLTFLRPTADIRVGILTIREKWEKYLQTSTSTLTEEYLREKYPIVKAEENILINGTVCPNPVLVDQVKRLQKNEALVGDSVIIAMHVDAEDLEQEIYDTKDNSIKEIQAETSFLKINNTWDIFVHNAEAIKSDFELLTKGRTSAPLNNSNHIINAGNIFVEQGASIYNASLNASSGPVYIARDAEIMEGALIRGPFALGERSIVKMGAKIYGATNIGHDSKVGGELNNVQIFAYSNKAHDGFLGNSVIAEWCNLGADTNNSNLKNTYENVKMWDYVSASFINTGLQFCGLVMGDHSKCGINTMFNTGTVVGVNANIFGSGFQRNFVPSFSWGGTGKMMKYDLEKAINTATEVFKRRGKIFDKTEQNILSSIHKLSLGEVYV